MLSLCNKETNAETVVRVSRQRKPRLIMIELLVPRLLHPSFL
jgi:hypothetical protein